MSHTFPSPGSKLPQDGGRASPHRGEERQAESAAADFAPLHATAKDVRQDSQHQRAAVECQEAFDRAEDIDAEQHEDEAVELYLVAAAAAEKADEWFIEALCCERVAEFLTSPSPPRDVDKAMRMFRRASLAYERCGLFKEAREASYRSLRLRRHHAAELDLNRTHRFELWLYDVTSGFGHRPLRVVRTALLIVLGYAVTFWTIGGVFDPENHATAGFLDCVYFSGTTFTTVGFGDFLPAPHARLLAMSEGIVGAFLVGFFVVVLWRRLSHG
jgi:hypothetical protein